MVLSSQVAEGIETQAELTSVTELGVKLGQGYLLGEPSRAKTWNLPPSPEEQRASASSGRRRLRVATAPR